MYTCKYGAKLFKVTVVTRSEMDMLYDFMS